MSPWVALPIKGERSGLTRLSFPAPRLSFSTPMTNLVIVILIFLARSVRPACWRQTLGKPVPFVLPGSYPQGRLQASQWGQGLVGALPKGSWFLPSPVRLASGSPPLAGSVSVGPPLAPPSRGAGGPLCSFCPSLFPPVFLS